jgi:hypothetical protein
MQIKDLLRRLGIVLGILIIFSFPGNVYAAENIVVSIITPDQPVRPGEVFTVKVEVQPHQEIAGVQFNLSFNPTRVILQEITEGNLLQQTNANTYFIPGQIDSQSGTITNVSQIIITPGVSVSNPGTVAILSFVAGTSPGTCGFTLSEAIIGDVNGNSLPIIYNNGQVLIQNAATNSPVLNSIGNKTVKAGASLAFQVTATDADADPLTFSASNLPSGAAFDQLTHTFSWVPTAAQTGVYSWIVFSVSDGSLTASETITIKVNSASKGSPGGGQGGGSTGGGGVGVAGGVANDLTDLNQVMQNTQGVFSLDFVARSYDGTCNLVIPQGTRGQTVEGWSLSYLVINPVPAEKQNLPPPPDGRLIGLTYTLGPEGTTFSPGVNIFMLYDPRKLPAGVSEEDLVIAYWDMVAQKWAPLDDCQVDPDTHRVRALLSHFSTYTILALPPKPPLFQISGLQLNPTEPVLGQPLRISAQVTNQSRLSGSYQAVATINGNVLETREIYMEGHQSQEIEFEYEPSREDSYTVSLGGETLKFEVAAPACFTLSPLSLSSPSIYPGEKSTVNTTVINTGTAPGIYAVVLRVNGYIQSVQSLILKPGTSQEVNFIINQTEPAVYQLDINGLEASLEVKPVPPRNFPELSNTPDARGLIVPLMANIFNTLATVSAIGALFLLLVRRLSHKKSHSSSL